MSYGQLSTDIVVGSILNSVLSVHESPPHRLGIDIGIEYLS